MIDYPGELAATVFASGCNFRCHFCYNPMLVVPKGHPLIEEGGLLDFLAERKGKIDGVVVTGGEPTMQSDLPEFLAKIKKLGYKIKLDTNGTNPEMLEKVISPRPSSPPTPSPSPEGGLVDYIAMDIKGPLDKYQEIVGVNVDLENIKKSVKIIIESGLPHEFRTTLVPGLHKKEDMEKMGEMIRGADKWFLQFFKSNTGLVDKSFEEKPAFTYAEMEEMRKMGEKYVKKCEVRG